MVAALRLVLIGLVLATLSPAPPAEASPFRATVRASQADRDAERDSLFRYLGAARDENEGRAIEREVWLFWLEAPGEREAALMNEALERRHSYDFEGAEERLDRLIELAPHWAEAWNQRATVRFQRGRDEASLSDIEEVLQREPYHFGAMAGQAIILMRQGRFRTAQTILRRAVAIHPFLRERAMILPAPEDPEEERRI